MDIRHLIASLVALATAAGTVAGCGQSDAGPNAARSGASARHASGSGRGVTISNFKFMPRSITVSQGTRITVTNRDSTAHTATADDGRSFDTQNIDPGASATMTLAKRGTYRYHCEIHPFMHGTLVVN